MKKFLNAIAIMMAFVMVVEVPVSAAGNVVANNGSVAVAAAEVDGDDASNVDTNDGSDTNDGNDTTDGDDTNDGKDTTAAPQVVAVVINGSESYNVEAGYTGTLSAAVVTNSEDAKYEVKWTSSSNAVTVKGEGSKCTFTAVNGGKAVITVTAGGKSDSVVVNVKEYTTAMNFAQAEYKTYVKHKIDFADELIKTPANSNDAVTYSSSNPKLVSVDKNGVATMKKKTAEAVVITAATERGIFAQTEVVVEAGNPAKKVEFKEGKSATLEQIGDFIELNTVLTAKSEGECTDVIQSWSVSKKGIVEVEDNGDGSAVVTAVGVGKVKVTAKASSGKKAVFTVTTKAPLTSLSVVDSVYGKDSIEVAPKKKVTLVAVKDPAENKDKVKWKSLDTSVASVNGKGVVTAKKAGEAKITATCGTQTAEFTITVVNTEITGMGDIEGEKELLVGEETYYDAAVEGGSSADITWTSSNAKVLSIDADGYAVAKKSGKATIKAVVTKANGKSVITKKLTVKVQQPTTGLTMKKSVQTVIAGKNKSVTFTAVKAPKGAAGTVVYSISGDTTGVEQKGKSGNKIAVPSSAKAGDVIDVVASVGDVTAEGEIRLIEGKNTVKFVNSDIKKNTLKLEQGDEVDFGVGKGVELKYYTNEDVTYSVNKTGVISVTADGYVYALHPGTVKLTAKTTSGAKKVLTIKVSAASTEDDGTTDGTTDGGTTDGGTTDGTTDGK